MDYKKAGVDRMKGDEASFRAYTLAKKTYRKEVKETEGIPYFGASFKDYKHPCLLAGADGVGTKLKIAFMMGIHNTVGIDLVAMSVNDLIRRGAEPIMFLPYLATSKIVPKVVEKDGIVSGKNIRKGDVLIGLASSGLHSNGFSLARKVLLAKYKLEEKIDELGGKRLGEEMLIPTKIYVKPVLKLLKTGVEIHGIAHITGGGIIEKLGKIMPKGLMAKVKFDSWKVWSIFNLIQKNGGIDKEEMYRTFNMGLGMILVVPKKEVTGILETIEGAKIVGEVKAE